MSEHPEWNWTNVPAYEKARVRDSINGQLRREGILELGEDIIRWRMSICIRDVKQWAGTSALSSASTCLDSHSVSQQNVYAEAWLDGGRVRWLGLPPGAPFEALRSRPRLLRLPRAAAIDTQAAVALGPDVLDSALYCSLRVGRPLR